ncbi:unnamed protein product [Bemisia tabaci]|uniref:Aldehyde dehydrogenase domain-containing protein n=1 Tax=Bemisia tabaci TaxID=7038 RepID=A0A9P0G5L8_BEMTA|nr:unnamed protein product [Bemisia tabaci]
MSKRKAPQLAGVTSIRKMSSSLFEHPEKTSYINGAWVPASSGKLFECLNPANGNPIGSVPDMDSKDTEVALAAAAEAFKTWQKTTAKERGVILRKWYDILEQKKDTLAKIITLESGKPIAESLGEVAYGNAFVDWFSEESRRINGEIIQSPIKEKQMLFVKQPIGVVSLITPWNFPYAMITRKAGAALAAGCTCVIKPAEDTPITALALAYYAHQAGIPKGVLNVVTCDRSNAPQIGKTLSTSPIVAGLSFTGSTEVGKLLYQQCSTGVKRIGLELGGNAPFIVFENADLNMATDGAIALKFRNCGQTCISANRFLIHEAVFDKFINMFADKMKKLVVGDGSKPGVNVGPLTNKAQFTKVSRILADAKEKGAKIVCGGKPASHLGELFFEPTLITGITPGMACYSEEIFGPLAICIPFKTEDEAVTIANSTRRGLAGYFYTSDISQAWRVARDLEVGMVGINESLITSAEAAFGGIKESGLGREGSSHGIEEYVYIKYLCFGNLKL